MFLKRLSTALCAIVCFGGFVLGTNPEAVPNVKTNVEENSLAAPLGFTPTIIGHNPECHSDENGYFEFTILNPTNSSDLSYSYVVNLDGIPEQTGNWTGLNFTTTNELGPGEYYISITELSTGDSYPTQPRILTAPTQVVLNKDFSSTPTCSSVAGQIELSAVGGTGNYTFYLNYGQADQYYSGNNIFPGILADKTYYPIVFDENDCSAQIDAIDINIAEKINPTSVDIIPINCEGDFAEIIISGLPEDLNQYEIQLNGLSSGFSVVPNGSTATISNLAGGIYDLEIVSRTCTTVDDDWSYPANPIVVEPFTALTYTWSIDPDVASVACFNNTIDLSVSVNGGKTGTQINLKLYENNIEIQGNPLVSIGDPFLLTNLEANKSYRIEAKVVGSPDCDALIRNFTIDGPSIPFELDQLIGIDKTCADTNDGQISVLYSGGVGAIEWSSDGGSTFNLLPSDNLIKGLSALPSYSILLKDDNCTTNPLTVSVGEPDPLVTTHNTASDVDVTCPGGSDGEISVSVSGGNGGYLYDLSGDETRVDQNAGLTFVVPSLSAGTYTVSVKDAEGCTATPISNVQIDEPTPITMSYALTDSIVCFGATTDLAVTANGGDLPIMTYELYKAGTLFQTRSTGGVANFPGLASSTYRLVVTNDPNCASIDTTFIIAATSQLTVYNYTDTITVNCAGDLADLDLRVSGSYPFTYELDGGIPKNFDNIANTTIPNISASIAGQTHQITIRDKNGCGKDIPVTVIEPEALSASLPVVADVLCKDDASGTVSLEVSGGTPGYLVTMGSLTQNSSNGIITFSNVPADNYTIQVTDNKGCSLPSPITNVIVEEPLIDFEISITHVTPAILCYGGQKEVMVEALGGGLSSKYINISGQGGVNQTKASGSIFLLGAGSYTVRATNDDGCEDVTQLVIGQPNPLIVTLVDSSDVSCKGLDDAMISFSIAGGTPGYTYGLGGFGTASNLVTGSTHTINGGLASDTYLVYVEDANNCPSNIEAVTISEPIPVDFTIADVDSAICFGDQNGSILITASGGTGAHSYAYTKDGVSIPYQASREFNNLGAGVYAIQVKDAANCPSINNGVEVTVEQPLTPVSISNATILQEITCADSSNAIIQINATGGEPYVGLQYSVSGRSYQSSNIITGLSSNTYSVMVKDSRGQCQKTWNQTIEIEDPDRVVILDPTVANVSCNNEQDGSAIVLANGGTGSYDYYLYEGSGLDRSQPNGNFYGLGGFTGTPQIASTINYRVEVRDGNDCFAQKTFTVRNPAKLEIDFVDKTDVTCNNDQDGELEVRVAGGTIANDYNFFDYRTSSTYATIEEISATEYRFTNLGTTDPIAYYQTIVSDDNGCSDTLQAYVEIINPAQVVIDSIELGAKLCYGDDNDETIIHASGGTGNFYYSLDNGDDIADAILKDSIFIGEEIGLKRPYVIDEKGCAKTGLQYEYEQPDQFLVDFEFSDIQCHTDTFGNMLLGIQGGTGQYELSINDANFTDVSNVHSINRSTSKDTTSVNLLESNIKLYDGIRYEFYLRDENNCHVQERSPRVNSYTDDFADTIFEIPPILVLVDLDQRPVFCGAENTGKILFEATGGTVTSEQGYILTAYNVNRDESKTNADGTFVVDKLFQGLHKCSLTDAHGCVAETNLDLFPYDTITVAHENEAIQIEITDLTLPTYDCKFDGAIEVDVYDYLFDGVTVKVEHYNEAIEVLKQFDPNDTIVADSDYIRLVNEDDTLYYATQQLVAEYMGIGDYVVTATDIYTSCSVSVPFFLESIGGLDCPDVNNYNVFTPHNNDEENENFTFFGSANQMYSLQVYSAYGELVYSSGEQLAPNDGIKWNGVDNKERPVPVGTYIYLMHLNIGVAGDTIMNGNVTILRADGR